MRISDWSSDVCSSDLPSVRQSRQEAAADSCCLPSTAASHLRLISNSTHEHSLLFAETEQGKDRRIHHIHVIEAICGTQGCPVRLGYSLPAWQAQATTVLRLAAQEIGRASCRERVGQYV